MLYTNLLFFLAAIVLVSTSAPSAEPSLPPLWALIGHAACLAGYSLTARRMFARTAFGPASYFSMEKRLLVLAVALFGLCLYGLDLPYYLRPLSLGGHVPALAEAAALGCFFVFLILLWLAGRPRYAMIFQQESTPWRFVWTNLKGNLPIVLPWLLISLVFDGLQLLPFPQVAKVLRSPWGDVLLLGLFALLLMFLFPPLVLRLWGCTPLPPGSKRDRMQAFCQSQGYRFPLYAWPLCEGQALTAAILGIVPGLRYLLITPALLDSLGEEELDSVLAHEIGHVRHRHLLLYLVLFLGFSVFAGAVAAPLPRLIVSSDLLYSVLPYVPMSPESVLALCATAPMLVLMLVYFRFVFGYFLRHFERQADAFAWRALGSGGPLIGAFEKILWFGGGNREEKNWHHFGIGDRIDFLRRCDAERGLVARHARTLHRHLLVCLLSLILLAAVLHRVAPMGSAPEAAEMRFAEAALLQKVRREPDNSLWLLYLGDVLQRRKMERKAIDAYEKALRLEADNAEINNNLAWLLLTATDAALHDPERALQLASLAARKSESGPILDTLAVAYWANGLVDEALVAEIRALRADPNNSRYYRRQMERFQTTPWAAGAVR